MIGFGAPFLIHDCLIAMNCVYLLSNLLTKPPRMRALVCSQGQERTCACLMYSDAFMTITMGGMDVDIRLIIKLRMFIKEECIMALCSMEKGGALMHKHFEMVMKGNCTRLPVLN